MSFGDKPMDKRIPRVSSLTITTLVTRLPDGNVRYNGSYVGAVVDQNGREMPTETRTGDPLDAFTAQEKNQLQTLLDKYMALLISKVEG